MHPSIDCVCWFDGNGEGEGAAERALGEGKLGGECRHSVTLLLGAAEVCNTWRGGGGGGGGGATVDITSRGRSVVCMLVGEGREERGFEGRQPRISGGFQFVVYTLWKRKFKLARLKLGG